MNWDPHFPARSPMFEALRSCTTAFGAQWPALQELQRILDEGQGPVQNAGGIPLRLVSPVRAANRVNERYEARIFLRGELETRERNWHDLLNVLVWRIFPATKAALNARHYEELARRKKPGNRGPVQDALTLFDEGGVIVVSSDQGLLDLLRRFCWKELFWHRREDVRAHMRFVLFGHALYEKALAPFVGITARGVLLQTPTQRPLAQPLELPPALDSRVASWIADPSALSATRDLAPLPVLGVPGWCADNECEEYYDDPGHFRRGRAGA